MLGRGERLFEDVGATDLTQLDVRHTKLVTHVRYAVPRHASSAPPKA